VATKAISAGRGILLAPAVAGVPIAWTIASISLAETVAPVTAPIKAALRAVTSVSFLMM